MQSIFNSKFIKYAISGFSALLADYSSFLLLYYLIHLPLLVSNSFSFLLGFIVSFTLQRNWTFKGSSSYRLRGRHQLVIYFGLSIFNLLISNTLILVLNKKLLIPAVFAKLVTVAIIAVWNYTIFRLFLFREAPGKN